MKKDLKKWLYVCLAVLIVIICGFTFSIYSAKKENQRKADEAHERLKDFKYGVDEALQGPDPTQYFRNIETIEIKE